MQCVSNTCNKYINIYNNFVILLHIDYKKEVYSYVLKSTRYKMKYNILVTTEGQKCVDRLLLLSVNSLFSPSAKRQLPSLPIIILL